ncbi:MAG: F0F1 ATP synthase subunit A [Anaerolineales bacterium]|nr:F0F1 ATP synthase subunit A [Anaerolineales bacterium]MCB9171352.1 F0F1 ATP synthase subunit A [Ardenticatenales bacterium]
MRRLLNPKVLGTIAVVLIVMVGSTMLLPVPLPAISLPAETIGHIGPFRLTNTFLHTLVADVVILLLAFFGTRNMKLVPSGLQNVLEWMIEALYNLAEGVTGDAARRYFPIVATIFFLVLVSNWMELIPGVDSVGWMETHAGFDHYPVEEAGPVLYLWGKDAYMVDGYGEAGAEDEAHSEEGVKEHHDIHTLPIIDGTPRGVVVPWLRASATDLNFTLALALIVMVMVQVYGFRAQGAKYFSKFFNTKDGPMNLFISVIELISEFGKVLSFTFRLFGNIFGGQVLLFVSAFLITLIFPTAFFGIEFFVGAIQAFVFFILALVFFNMATQAHH